jgi:hypothetical protein
VRRRLPRAAPRGRNSFSGKSLRKFVAGRTPAPISTSSSCDHRDRQDCYRRFRAIQIINQREIYYCDILS